jgi:hypothetical protein
MKISKIENLTTTDSHFNSPRPGYKKGDKGMTLIYAEI